MGTLGKKFLGRSCCEGVLLCGNGWLCVCVRVVVSFAVFDKLFLFQGLLDLYVIVCADDWVDGLGCVGGESIAVS